MERRGCVRKWATDGDVVCANMRDMVSRGEMVTASGKRAYESQSHIMMTTAGNSRQIKSWKRQMRETHESKVNG